MSLGGRSINGSVIPACDAPWKHYIYVLLVCAFYVCCMPIIGNFNPRPHPGHAPPPPRDTFLGWLPSTIFMIKVWFCFDSVLTFNFLTSTQGLQVANLYDFWFLSNELVVMVMSRPI